MSFFNKNCHLPILFGKYCIAGGHYGKMIKTTLREASLMIRLQFTLTPAMFAPNRTVLLSNDDFTVTAFIYPGGEQGLCIDNGRLALDCLPFRGQQIWDARADGESLRMGSMFEYPRPGSTFLMSDGAFLIHCGFTAMGNPGPEDNHPLHGELPDLAYDEASLLCGEDERGAFVALCGLREYQDAFNYHYTAAPELRLYAGETVAEVTMRLRNLRNRALEYMYLSHINFLPVDGSKLIYSAHPNDVSVYECDCAGSLPTEDRARLEAFTKKLMEDPALGDVVDASVQCYDPELCSLIRYTPDENGVAHAMQLKPDGSACYVAFHTDALPYALRWIARNGDENALGFTLPCTGDHLGRAHARRSGFLRSLPTNETVVLRYACGFLDPDSAKEKAAHIKRILSQT